MKSKNKKKSISRKLMVAFINCIPMSPVRIRNANEAMLLGMLDGLVEKKLLLPSSLSRNRDFVYFASVVMSFKLQSDGMSETDAEIEVSWFMYEYGLI